MHITCKILQLSLQMMCAFREQLLYINTHTHTHTHTCLTCTHICMLPRKVGKKHLINMYFIYCVVQNSGGENFGEINIISQYFTQPNSRFSTASYMLKVYAIVNLPKFFPTKPLKRSIRQRL